MSKAIRYPIGVHTFNKIIESGSLYVDKTAFVYDLATRYDYVFLSRPRRFGKSLLMSTFASYFKGEKELFKGLEIEKLEKDWKCYPVLRFDLSPANYTEPARLISCIEGSFRSIETEYGLSAIGDNLSVRFMSLIEQAYRKYGEKVVILIDEYDKPILDCLHDDNLHENMKAELRGFYSAIKASDEYIKFSMLTGITKFGKVSVFSGMNNLKDISLLPRFNAICGISETEFHDNFKDSIIDFSDEHGITEEEAWNCFKTTYDGYRFASRGEGIYNPFSVINAFDDNELNNYWYSTGTPSYLIKLIEANSYPLDKIEGERRSKDQLSDITDVSNDFIPFLFQSGYLTVKGYDPKTLNYTLGFPNHEVRNAFWNSLADHFLKGINGVSAFNVRKCVKEVNDGKPEEFMRSMKSLFADTSSEPEKNKEIHFQNMMAIACKMIGLNVRTEIHSSAGRCDMQILTLNYVYIFEFKIDDTAEEALKQILDKGYALPFAGDSRTIFIIGANFSTKTRTLDDWIIKRRCPDGSFA
ncbi:MAG: ATP-binding protein [Muribaculaceae bacterium]|nr:ATP-binding protein [Muribaculaceae bacterium]